MKAAVAAILTMIAVAAQLRMIVIFRRMISDVNAVLPRDTRIPAIGPSWLRGRVIQLHRQFFPASRLRRKLYGTWIIAMLAFASALICVVRLS